MFWAPKFWIFTGFLAGLSGAILVNIERQQYVQLSGESVTLPCKFKTKGSPSIIVVTWTAMKTNDGATENLILAHYHPMGVTDIKAEYDGRVSLDFSAGSGQANLKFSSVTPADNMIYSCRVQIPNDDEGKTADTTRLDVYEAVSTPICTIQGKAEFGKNINLTCHSEKGSPSPLYRWEARDERNMPRVMDHRAIQEGGVLSLYNISKDTSGYYRCTSANRVRSASCDIVLTVLPPLMRESLLLGGILGVMTGAIGSAVSVADRAFRGSAVNNGMEQTPTRSPSFF